MSGIRVLIARCAHSENDSCLRCGRNGSVSLNLRCVSFSAKIPSGARKSLTSRMSSGGKDVKEVVAGTIAAGLFSVGGRNIDS
jgi:hypothetical protein